MRYDNPDLIEALAGEYVLGTLRGHARRRFEALLRHRPQWQAAVHRWEARLSPLAEVAGEAQPPARLWTAIESRLDDRRHLATRGVSFWWRWLGVFSTTLALSLMVYFGVKSGPDESMRTLVAVLETPARQPAWLVSVDPGTGLVRVAALQRPPVQTGGSLELWALPREGKPVSLGTVSTTENGRVRKRLLRDTLASLQGFAISIEPRGGSPTGQPTGPIVFQGAANLL